MAPDYDLLPLMNKLEAFEHALALTRGDDVRLLYTNNEDEYEY